MTPPNKGTYLWRTVVVLFFMFFIKANQISGHTHRTFANEIKPFAPITAHNENEHIEHGRNGRCFFGSTKPQKVTPNPPQDWIIDEKINIQREVAPSYQMPPLGPYVFNV